MTTYNVGQPFFFPEDKGELVIIDQINPAAGSSYIIGPPAGECWLVRHWSFRFITDANPAARYFYGQVYTTGTNHLARVFSSSTQAASLDYQYFAMTGYPNTTVSITTASAGVQRMIPWVPVYLVNPWNLQVWAIDAQVGDDLYDGRIEFLRWRV